MNEENNLASEFQFIAQDQNGENKDHTAPTLVQASNMNTKTVVFKCRHCSVLHTDHQEAVKHFRVCNLASKVSKSGHTQQSKENMQPNQQHQTIMLIQCQICEALFPSTEQYVSHLEMHQNGFATSKENEQRYFIVTPKHETVTALHSNEHLKDHLTSDSVDEKTERIRSSRV